MYSCWTKYFKSEKDLIGFLFYTKISTKIEKKYNGEFLSFERSSEQIEWKIGTWLRLGSPQTIGSVLQRTTKIA